LVRNRPRTLRSRLALIFGLTTTIVAAGFGALLLHQARRQLANAIDEGLVPVATELAARVAAEGPGVISGPVAELHPPSDTIAQVLAADGRILATSHYLGDDRPLLPAASAATVAGSGRRVGRRVSLVNAGGGTAPVRVMALRVTTGNRPVVLATATSFDEPRRLESDLERALAVGLPILAAAVALGGWLVTGAMFRPVQSMIEGADTISAREPGERLEITGGGAELLALATRLNAMLERIEDAAARERAFLDDASHELRTPISIVRGELELARGQAGTDADLRGALDSVLDEVERLERLAHNLLVMARSRSGNLVGGDTPVDLETLVQRAVRAISRRAENRHVQIRCQGNAVVNGDESSLQRAVLNLLDNAVRYAESEVTVTVDEHRSLVDLSVVDDGPGFQATVLPRAFERFTRDPGHGGGMGLGLAITATIAAAHGGHISAVNRPGGGAEVRLRLPAA
jgi:signal transduction histidine kinase